MGPFERVRARALAFDVLGVTHGSAPEAIRAAWRRVAFERHPDQHGGDQTRFIQAKAAYDFLLGDDAYAYSQGAVAADATRAQAAVTPRSASATAGAVAAPTTSAARAVRRHVRPALAARVSPLDEAVCAACAALFEIGDDAPARAPCAAHLRLHRDAPSDMRRIARDHVAHAIERQGRQITYLVAASLAPGVNRVALPTAILEDRRKPRPEILALSVSRAVAGEVTIPDDVRSRLFPGARGVRIRFGVGPAAAAPAE
ncbi:MAG: J domain-containing protein [Pseudomonadota bacterium]